MAATLTADQEITYVSFPIEKAETTPDGDLVVYGKATDGSVDSDEQIVDPDFAGKALQEWLDTGGNIRVQHNPQRDPAGKGVAVEVSPDGHFVKSLIVEPTAKRLVEKGVLRAYSVGIARPVIMRDSVARGGRITGGQIVELSLVDRPANKNCGIALVKSAADGAPEYVGKVFGADDLLVKYAGEGAVEKSVTVELPEDVSVAFTPADLAKLVAHRQRAEQRMAAEKEVQASGKVVDSSGKDRSHVADEDFAGPGKTFPIETPGDVSDAASLAHHAADPAQVRANIKRIARRKFPKMDLPPSLDGDGKNAGAEVTKVVEDDYQPQPYDSGGEGEGEPVTCPKCGKGDAADAKYCDQCGFHLAGADGVRVKNAAEGKTCSLCKGSGKIRDGHVTCPKCKGDGKLTPGEAKDFANRSVEADVEKGKCPGCGAKGDSKFCPACGKKMVAKTAKQLELMELEELLKGKPGMPGKDEHVDAGDGDGDEDDGVSSGGGTAEGEDDDKGTEAEDEASHENPKAARPKVKKGKKGKFGKPTPTDGVDEAAKAKPVPPHREPDSNNGGPVEDFEDDAGLQEPGEKEPERAAAKFRMLNVPHSLGVLHDLTCPAYSSAAVAKAHPFATLDRLISVPEWQEKALSLVAGAPLDLVPELMQLGQQAATLKATPAPLVDDIREELFKAFQDANPGPGSAPKPGDINPGSFNRPYIATGHGAASPGSSGPNKAPMPSHQIAATDYQRGYIAGGHATPGASQGTRTPPPATTGLPTAVSFTSLHRQNAAQAMSAMHDHVAQSFPDLCPVYHGGSPYGDAGPAGKPVPVAVGGPGMASAGKAAKPSQKRLRRELARQVRKGDLSLEAARQRLGLDAPEEPVVVKAAAPEPQPDAGQDLLVKAMAAATDEMRGLRKLVKKQAKQLSEQRRMLDGLASQPDPDGPYRGVSLTKSSAAPVGPPSVSQRVELANDALIRELQMEARNSWVPQQREAALAKLREIYAKNL